MKRYLTPHPEDQQRAELARAAALIVGTAITTAILLDWLAPYAGRALTTAAAALLIYYATRP
jgi:hypothetical protein